MASGVLFASGFDWLADASNFIPYGWTGGSVNGLGAAYRRGSTGKGIQILDTWNGYSSTSGRPYVTLAAAYDHVVLQFGYSPRTLKTELFCEFHTNLTTSVQLHVNRRTDGSLQVVRGSTVLGTSDLVMTSVTSYYGIEIRVKFDNSVGEVEIKINGVQVLNLTGVDTQNQATNDCSGFAFHCGGTVYWLDDILFRDYSVVSSMIGYQSIRAYMPSGAGDQTDFTPSTGNNWSCVDEIPANTTDYVESSTPGDIDLYTHAAHGIADGTVFAVQVHHRAQKTDGATRQFRALMKHSATTTNGATKGLSSGYATFTELFDDCPGQSGWDLDQLDDVQVGQEEIA